jgi:UDP:flavonoid glycosyltransferase YjiC (YdhE family)
MCIVYGAVGDGLGHAIRAQVLFAKPRQEGQEVAALGSGRAVGALSGLRQNVRAWLHATEAFEPQVVPSEFETWTCFRGKLLDIAVIPIDTMQVLNSCKHPRAVHDGQRRDFELARAVAPAELRYSDHRLVTTFFEVVG